MKQVKKSFWLSFTITILLSCTVFFFAYINADTVGQQPRRAWDIALDTFNTAETVESKVCAFEVSILQDCPATFTAIQAVTDKACTVESAINVIDSSIDQELLTVQTVLSRVELIDQTVVNLSNSIKSIRVDDFGGTWTALDGLEQNLCDKFESSFDDLATIESKIDQLTADNLVQFTATFTKLEVLATDVFDTMTTVQNFADQLDSDLAGIDSLIDIVKMQLTSIDSKIELLDINISQDFSGTFTAIDGVLEKLCEVDNKVDQLDITLSTACVDTFTSLKAIENKTCTVESKIDILSVLLEQIKEKISIIDEPEFDCSLVDVLTMDLLTVGSKIDII